jgi:hypothetical protein
MKNKIKLAGLLAIAIMVITCTPKQSGTVIQPQTSSESETTAVQAESKPTTTQTQTSSDFQMEGTTLAKYNGKGGSVTIPSSVTKISSSAFYGCASMTSITIPSLVYEIGISAFVNCTSLTSVTFISPSSVSRIEDSAFFGCIRLTSVDIPSSVTYIGSAAFDSTGLTSVSVSNRTNFVKEDDQELSASFPKGIQIHYRDEPATSADL